MHIQTKIRDGTKSCVTAALIWQLPEDQDDGAALIAHPRPGRPHTLSLEGGKRDLVGYQPV